MRMNSKISGKTGFRMYTPLRVSEPSGLLDGAVHQSVENANEPTKELNHNEVKSKRLYK